MSMDTQRQRGDDLGDGGVDCPRGGGASCVGPAGGGRPAPQPLLHQRCIHSHGAINGGIATASIADGIGSTLARAGSMIAARVGRSAASEALDVAGARSKRYATILVCGRAASKFKSWRRRRRCHSGSAGGDTPPPKPSRSTERHE